ncbi:hypothetical protein B0H34DRAFT_854391 [Crassisporium funariophilum]|nr:hypothetical protein B0H34DRAFT_854391 [Crassisporium funariophilum]
MSTNYVTNLNNFLQARKQSHLLAWTESSVGPSSDIIWTIDAKIGGEIKGTGSGISKSDARQLAAKRALEALRPPA